MKINQKKKKLENCDSEEKKMSNHPPYTVKQRLVRTLIICPIMVVCMVSYNLLLHSAWSFSNLGNVLLYMFPIAYFLDFVIMFHLVRAIVHKINRPKMWWIYPVVNVGLMAICCSGIAILTSVGFIHGFSVAWAKAFAINYPVALVLLIFVAKPAGDKIVWRKIES